MIGMGITIPAYLTIIFRQDWNHLVDKAARRAQVTQGSDEAAEEESMPLLTSSKSHLSYEQNKNLCHQRTPSNPQYFSSQATFGKLPKADKEKLHGKAFRELLCRRLLYCGFMLAVFVTALLLRLGLHPDLHNHNHSTVANLTVNNK